MQRFYGTFAFAIWDMRHAGLFLARDRFVLKQSIHGWVG